MLRKEHGMSQGELAELINAGQNNISRIEKGKYNIGFDTLQGIAKVFNKKIKFEDMIPKHRFSEEDFKDFLEFLLKSGRIDNPKEIGIIKCVIDNGYDSLSTKQMYVFNNTIAQNSVDECVMCLCDIPWCEMMEALENGGYCCHCRHLIDKDD